MVQGGGSTPLEDIALGMLPQHGRGRRVPQEWVAHLRTQGSCAPARLGAGRRAEVVVAGVVLRTGHVGGCHSEMGAGMDGC